MLKLILIPKEFWILLIQVFLILLLEMVIDIDMKLWNNLITPLS